MDSDEVKIGKVYSVVAIGQSLVVWRTSEGKPVVFNATCPHMGANLGVGGEIRKDEKTGEDVLECPFHRWCFDKNGNVTKIPYLQGQKARKCGPKGARAIQYRAKDWCGLLCVYFHCDEIGSPEKDPIFDLPSHVEAELRDARWSPFGKWDIGRVNLLPTDWVDQAGDWAHFHTLHNRFVIPWTTIGLPSFFNDFFSISHDLKTYVGEKAASLFKSGDTKNHHDGRVNKHFIYFTDNAGICWRGKRLKTTASQTLEMYVGPAIMVFHIPFGTNAFKVIVTTTPTPGGSVMRARTFSTAGWNPITNFVTWLLVGISASQLQQDISIMENRLRLRKPRIGPYMRTNAWLRQFYTERSELVGHDRHRSFQDVLAW
eukprot:g887.t1